MLQIQLTVTQSTILSVSITVAITQGQDSYTSKGRCSHMATCARPKRQTGRRHRRSGTVTMRRDALRYKVQVLDGFSRGRNDLVEVVRL
jgi:hypothetical protein